MIIHYASDRSIQNDGGVQVRCTRIRRHEKSVCEACDLCNNATHYTMDNVDGDKLMDAVPKEEVNESH